MYRVGVLGASGYAGAQLASILYGHPTVESVVLAVQSKPDTAYRDLYPGCASLIQSDTVSVQQLVDQLSELDVLFTALPHGVSMKFVAENKIPDSLIIIDLGADFRLNSAENFKAWYHEDHPLPAALTEWVYGLPEWNRKDIQGCKRIANPGCYPTASLLALQPLLINHLIDPKSIIIDAKSGVTGAGRSLNLGSLYCECADSIKAYGVTNHRHTAEIEETASAMFGQDILLNFTPHLVPMKRGILSTVYGQLQVALSENELNQYFKKQYENEAFVRLRKEIPETRWVQSSNFCDLSVRLDPRTNRVIVVSAIDNLMKGAASQAVQNMNIALNLDESTGLNFNPILP